MAIVNGRTPRLAGVEFTPVKIRATSSDSNVNQIPALTKVVKVTGVVNGATDFIVLPSLASCPDGHKITILCSASSAFEMRTPSASAEEINSEDCDGTKEYLMTDTQIVTVVKINDTIGWCAYAHSAIGAAVTAVVPD